MPTNYRPFIVLCCRFMGWLLSKVECTCLSITILAVLLPFVQVISCLPPLSRTRHDNACHYPSFSLPPRSTPHPISGGFVGIVKSVKCPQGHVLQLSDRDTGWSCDGRRDDGGCRKESMPPGRRPNRYRCQSCDYDLCDACYEAKGQGTNPCERLFGRRKEKSDF